MLFQDFMEKSPTGQTVLDVSTRTAAEVKYRFSPAPVGELCHPGDIGPKADGYFLCHVNSFVNVRCAHVRSTTGMLITAGSNQAAAEAHAAQILVPRQTSFAIIVWVAESGAATTPVPSAETAGANAVPFPRKSRRLRQSLPQISHTDVFGWHKSTSPA
jgi:hypothetical protein